MKNKMIGNIFLITFSCLALSFAYASPVRVIKRPGVFYSVPKNFCTAALKISSQGGFLQLSIGRDKDNLAHIADDITGIAWATSSTLIYSVSPVYGNPGVFLVTCTDDHKITTLVSAKHLDSAYPKGSEYFEIRSISGDRVEYYYGDDVDKIDFKKLRYERNIRVVRVPKAE